MLEEASKVDEEEAPPALGAVSRVQGAIKVQGISRQEIGGAESPGACNHRAKADKVKERMLKMPQKHGVIFHSSSRVSRRGQEGGW